MEQEEIKHFVEAALIAAGRPLSADQLKALFDGRSAPDKGEIRKAVATLNEEYEPRGLEIAEVASGYRMQIKAAMADRLTRLWEERPPRYSRALFETLALVAYRQPITRGEIEEIRGVSVSSNIVRTLMERDWVRIVGHRDVPGRPAMFGTTRTFLDYFGLRKLDELPPLADLADWESLRVQLNLPDVESSGETAVPAAGAANEDVPPQSGSEDDLQEDNLQEDSLQEDNLQEDNLQEDNDAVGNEAAASETIAEDTAEPEPAVDDGESAAAAKADDGTDDEDELVVSEWPDPSDARAIASLETRDTRDTRGGEDDDDRDASAGGN